MARWGMVIDLDKCVACQGCTVACRMENNTPIVAPEEANLGRAMLWNEVFPLEQHSQFAAEDIDASYIPRPCQHCDNPPCIKVCPVHATFKQDETGGQVLQKYDRCIGCRFCTVACPYGVRYFNWYAPEWTPEMAQHLNPDEETAPRVRGIVEKCSFCIQRLRRAEEEAEAAGRAFRPSDYQPACVTTCTGKARFFGDLDDPDSLVSRLAGSRRAFRLLEELGTRPKVVYLKEG
jgi:molybdopterin-containing oxidoreductase family iron-sulfur binding subunit